MKLEAYSIYDSKSKIFSPPFFLRSRGEAIRAFSTTAGDKTNNVGKFPEDFTLFQVGHYDDNTGALTQGKLDSIGLASQFVVEEAPPLAN